MKPGTLRCGVFITMSALLVGAWTPAQDTNDLETGFRAPPREARVRAFWWWLNGHVTREAITRDLEAMRAAGMGGALIFDGGGASQRGNAPVPAGPLFGSPAWRELFKHAVTEADRLGLELSFTIQSGWNLGGPSVTPAQSAQHVTWSETQIVGPGRVDVALPLPKHRDGFYRDSVVVAYQSRKRGLPPPEVEAKSSMANASPVAAADGAKETFWVSADEQKSPGPEWLQVRYVSPVSAGGMRVYGRPKYGPRHVEILASDDGYTFTSLATNMVPDGVEQRIIFPETRAPIFRCVFHDSYDPLQPENPRNVQVAEICLLDIRDQPIATQPRVRPIRDFEIKAAFVEGGSSAPDCAYLLEDVPDQPGEEDVYAEDVLNLTQYLGADGCLRWDAPEGTWTILRFGHTYSGARVSTSSGEWQGRALDPLSPDALRAYWRENIAPILAEIGPLAGHTLNYAQTDSWELHGVNWTDDFPAEFVRQRGYDLAAWMPVLAGRIVDNRAMSNRFLADFRKTIGDCIANRHYGVLAELARAHNMGIHPEAGGPHAGPFDALKNMGRCDWMMSEFWAPSAHRPREENRYFVKQAASAAHIYGRPIVCAEGFTTIGPHWNDVLWSSQKPSFDHEACAGLNLVFWHTFTCSPPEMGLPGQEYFAGTHFNPQITWWKQAPAFVAYLNRCQFLLQQGRFVADVCCYYGDHVPNFVRRKQDDPAKVLPAYDYDVFNEEVLLTRMNVDAGRIVLPDGMSYRIMTLPMLKYMSLEALWKARQLVDAGATLVLGPKPVRPPGLQGGSDADIMLQKLADEMWGPDENLWSGERRIGQGRVFCGRTAKEALESQGIPPDVEVDGATEGAAFDWIHRSTSAAEIYFIANLTSNVATARVTFRVEKRQPEIWDPVTGDIRAAGLFAQARGRTSVPLEFDPYGTLFLVFRKPVTVAAGDAERNQPMVREAAVLPGPWTVTFDPAWGAPADPVPFERLESWTERPEAGLRFYSGTATYRTTFDAPAALCATSRRAAIDLGRVINLAEVRLNGQPLGVLWTPPFRAEVTGLLKISGNELEVDVVNTWFNRLCGDRTLPPEQRFTKTNIRIQPDSQPVESGLLGPVRLMALE